jgi:hypothetical protein
MLEKVGTSLLSIPKYEKSSPFIKTIAQAEKAIQNLFF